MGIATTAASTGDDAAGYEQERSGGEDAERDPGSTARNDLPPRMAVAVTVTVLLGIITVDGMYAVLEHLTAWRLAEGAVAAAAIAVLQLAHSFPWLLPRLASVAWLTLGLQAVASFAPFADLGEAWLSMPAFLAGSVLLVLRPRLAWPAFLLVVAATDYALLQLGAGWDIVLTSISVALAALGVFGLSRLAALVTEVRAARTRVAGLALAAERLRFARDLHDLLGTSLSAISFKCEHVRRLVGNGTDRAQQELADILRMSRQALADVRAVARGYREVSLATEAEAAESMLAAVGIRSTVRLADRPLPGSVDTLLATVLREGLTNMLRHSAAERCVIETVHADGAVRLSLANDGVTGPPAPAGQEGRGGLDVLTAWVGGRGGSLHGRVRADGWFLLEARVPLAERADRAGAAAAGSGAS
ncbi:sensor histidine kinase, partial [Streptomyces montanisoli]